MKINIINSNIINKLKNNKSRKITSFYLYNLNKVFKLIIKNIIFFDIQIFINILLYFHFKNILKININFWILSINLYILSIFSIVQEIKILNIQKEKFKQLKILYPKNIILHSNKFIHYLNLFLLILHPCPWQSYIKNNLYNQSISITYIEMYINLENLFLIISLTRLIFIGTPKLWLISKSNKFNNFNIALKYGMKSISEFLFKYILNFQIIYVSIYLFISILIFLGLSLMILEIDNYLINFKSYLNTFYFIYITIATVGYGDMYPISNYSKIITMLSFTVGFIITSIVTYGLINLFNLNTSEHKAYQLYTFEKNINKYKMKLIEVYYYISRINQFLKKNENIFDFILNKYYIQKLNFNIKTLRNLKKKIEIIEIQLKASFGDSLQSNAEKYFEIYLKLSDKARLTQIDIENMTKNWIKNIKE